MEMYGVVLVHMHFGSFQPWLFSLILCQSFVEGEMCNTYFMITMKHGHWTQYWHRHDTDACLVNWSLMSWCS